jgi:hypothetical protein
MGPVGSAPPPILTQSSFVIERGGTGKTGAGKKDIGLRSAQQKRSATNKHTKKKKKTKESGLRYLISAGESITNFSVDCVKLNEFFETPKRMLTKKTF